MQVKQLYVEYRKNYLGMDNKRPRFSWELLSECRDTIQKAYRIQVSNDAGFQNLYWDTEKVESNESIQIDYAGEDIKSCVAYYARVKVWDEYDNESDWSGTAIFETAFLTANRWDAQWIRPSWDRSEDENDSVSYFRKEFSVEKEVVKARLYATSQGMYNISLNGKKVGEYNLTPYWTDYKKRLQYQTYDVTDCIKSGKNGFGAVIGEGWYLGVLAWDNTRKIYGTDQSLLAQLHLTYSDGSQDIIKSDLTWKCSRGPITMSSIYHGEDYDARLEMPGWDCAGFNDSQWTEVRKAQSQAGSLIAQEGEHVVSHENIKPVSNITAPNGDKILDFGQNMVGLIRVEFDFPEGTEIYIDAAEVLDKDGNFYRDNYRAARSAVKYIASGKGRQTYQSSFTFFGFRYLRIKGWKGEINKNDFTGIVLHSDFKQTGFFETSEPLLNQLQHNIIWGQKGNFVDVPTDCPQRDERLGWTGDAQAFASTACFNMDVANFYTKYLHDVACEQEINGSIPHVVPNVLGEGASAATGWADVVTILPWEMYVSYGDKRILKNMYPAMKAWVEHMRRVDEEWRKSYHFGDWLAMDSIKEGCEGGTDERYIAWAFQIHSTELTLKAARVLNYYEDAQRYRDLLMELTDGFLKEFITPSGRLAVTTQTAHVLALQFNIVEGKVRDRIAKDLADMIKGKDTHLETGFLGTPYLNFALTSSGYIDLAYDLLLKTDFPSWLYQVEKGATTIWEHWDGIKTDGSFWSEGMNSFNHYAYGAIGNWMYKTIVGINQDEKRPGYKKSILHPRPGGGLTYAKGKIDTMYGPLSCAWDIRDNTMHVTVSVPVNTSSTLILDDVDSETLKENEQSLLERRGIRSIKTVDHAVHIELGSGTYAFTADIKS